MSDLPKPPHSPQTEWSVIAQMLAKPEVIGEVIGAQVEADDFFSQDCRLIFERTVTAHYADDRIDALTIGEALRFQLSNLWACEESEVAGRLYARQMSAGFQDTASDHAHLLRQMGDKRRLQQLCLSAVHAIEDGSMSAEEVGDFLTTEAAKVTTGAAARGEILSWVDTGRQYVQYLRRLKLARERGIELSAYSGLKFMDTYTRGVAPSELMMVAGEPGVGKALSLDTPIPTPGGWTTMGDVQPGARVFDERGAACRVLGVSDVMYDRPCYRVVFSDGQSVVADGEHLWLTTTRADRAKGGDAALRTTSDIAATLRRSDGGFNHRIELTAALTLPAWPLTVDPWVLGFWLGDGNTATAAVTVGDGDREDVAAMIERRGYPVRRKARGLLMPEGLGDGLRALGVLHHKHIPPEYLRASEEQREALMAGLIDSDGAVRGDGRVEISTMHSELADQICELIATLGLKFGCKRSRATIDGRFAGWRYRIGFMPFGPMALLNRKRRGSAKRDLHSARFVEAVTPIPSVPVRCIRVDGGMFLAGRGMIPTHNSAVCWVAAEGFARRQMQKPPDKRIATLVLSLEMGLVPSSGRLAQTATGIDGGRLREGDVSDAEVDKVVQGFTRYQDLPMFFNFASNFRVSQMRALIVDAIRRHNVGLVVVDHFRMFDLDRRVHNLNQEDELKARFLKENIAKDLNVAVMCLAHTIKLRREGSDGRPTLGDLRGSGQVAAHCDIVTFIYRPFMYATASEIEEGVAPSENAAEMIFAKNRNGALGTSEFYFNPAEMQVRDNW